jgi:hypothetical protein
MDTMANQIARELTQAINAAVTNDPAIEACREKARAAGFELKVTLEAVIGFAAAPKPVTTRAKASSRKTTRLPLDITANDRRFLKSLRIAADETLSDKNPAS